MVRWIDVVQEMVMMDAFGRGARMGLLARFCGGGMLTALDGGCWRGDVDAVAGRIGAADDPALPFASFDCCCCWRGG